jgi:purine-nucleoside phosphorylase
VKRKRLEAAADYLRAKAGGDIDCAIVLGSGFGAVLRDRIDGTTVPYRKIDGMPQPSIAGHAGEAHIGMLRGRRVVAFSGRFHLYEGRETHEVIYPVVAAAHAGARTIVLTNAAGGVNPAYSAGDLMLIVDQINLTGTSPLTGPDLLPGASARFIDMVNAYAPYLRDLAHNIAGEYGITLHDGVYAGLTGPAYETPAEAAYLRAIGADAVGMSTVLETIAARALGRDVAGFSLITNVHGAGAPTSHEEVLEAAARSAGNVATMIEGIVANAKPSKATAAQLDPSAAQAESPSP